MPARTQSPSPPLHGRGMATGPLFTDRRTGLSYGDRPGPQQSDTAGAGPVSVHHHEQAAAQPGTTPQVERCRERRQAYEFTGAAPGCSAPLRARALHLAGEAIPHAIINPAPLKRVTAIYAAPSPHQAPASGGRTLHLGSGHWAMTV
nr:unnamed protein product [Digitaria exilis]